jgi:hypothetical protein
MLLILVAVAGLITAPCCPTERTPVARLQLAGLTTTGAGAAASGSAGSSCTDGQLDFSCESNSALLTLF